MAVTVKSQLELGVKRPLGELSCRPFLKWPGGKEVEVSPEQN
jgi:hypothetical protein